MSPVQPLFSIDVMMNKSISMRPSNAAADVYGSEKHTRVSPSSQDRGFHRLLPEGVMELKADDEVVLVISIELRRKKG